MSFENLKCKDCIYWKPKSGNYGECRRYAPKPGDGTAKFPVTFDIMWCGDFKAKEHTPQNY